MDDDKKSHRSWDLIQSKGVKHIYPSHAMAFGLEEEGV
jgi:hypothetical protein